MSRFCYKEKIYGKRVTQVLPKINLFKVHIVRIFPEITMVVYWRTAYITRVQFLKISSWCCLAFDKHNYDQNKTVPSNVYLGKGKRKLTRTTIQDLLLYRDTQYHVKKNQLPDKLKLLNWPGECNQIGKAGNRVLFNIKLSFIFAPDLLNNLLLAPPLI